MNNKFDLIQNLWFWFTQNDPKPSYPQDAFDEYITHSVFRMIYKSSTDAVSEMLDNGLFYDELRKRIAEWRLPDEMGLFDRWARDDIEKLGREIVAFVDKYWYAQDLPEEEYTALCHEVIR